MGAGEDQGCLQGSACPVSPIFHFCHGIYTWDKSPGGCARPGCPAKRSPTPFCSPGEGLVTGIGPGPSIFSPNGSKNSTQMGRGGCALRFPAASPLQPLPAAGAPSHSLAEGSPRAPSYQQLEVFPRDVSQTLQALQNHLASLSLSDLSFWPPYSHQPLGLWEAPSFELIKLRRSPLLALNPSETEISALPFRPPTTAIPAAAEEKLEAGPSRDGKLREQRPEPVLAARLSGVVLPPLRASTAGLWAAGIHLAAAKPA